MHLGFLSFGRVVRSLSLFSRPIYWFRSIAKWLLLNDLICILTQFQLKLAIETLHQYERRSGTFATARKSFVSPKGIWIEQESASFESMVLCAKAFYSLASSLTSLSTQHIADAIITGFTLVEGDRRTACCYHLSSLHLLFFPLESSSFKSSGSCTTCNHVNSTSDDRNFSGFLPLLLISCSSTRNLIVVQLFFLLQRERGAQGAPSLISTLILVQALVQFASSVPSLPLKRNRA